MSKAEDYIREKSHIIENPTSVWISSYNASKAVEIAREEIYEWLEKYAANFVGLADDEHTPIGDTKAFYGTKSLIYYLKQAMKDE